VITADPRREALAYFRMHNTPAERRRVLGVCRASEQHPELMSRWTAKQVLDFKAGCEIARMEAGK
jgi:hypothetical protein